MPSGFRLMFVLCWIATYYKNRKAGKIMPNGYGPLDLLGF